MNNIELKDELQVYSLKEINDAVISTGWEDNDDIIKLVVLSENTLTQQPITNEKKEVHLIKNIQAFCYYPIDEDFKVEMDIKNNIFHFKSSVKIAHINSLNDKKKW